MKIQPVSAGKTNYLEDEKIKSKENIKTRTLSSDNLHKSFRKMFILGQIFGFLPTQGILGPDSRSLHFSWKSIRVVYSLLTILGSCFVSVMQIYKIAIKGMDLAEANRLFFYVVCGVLAGYLYLIFAKNWPKLMKHWSGVELSVVSYGWPPGLDRQLNILTYGFMGIALVEYILFQSSKIVMSFNCNSNAEDAIRYFLGNMTFSHIFSIISYDVFKGLILQFITLQLTFVWTFNDLFVMLISTTLAYRFQQITSRIQSVAEAKIEAEIIWKNLREDYNRICKLCKIVDKELANIVLMTFASDLCSLLVQLFHSLKPMQFNLQRFYFFFSFGLVILRTFCLCLFGAKVHDESKKPMVILNAVSSNVYNLEIQRFIQQIGTSEVAITGKNFFSITRGLILSIAGAIVTYELVLMQFNDSVINDSGERIGSCPVYT